MIASESIGEPLSACAATLREVAQNIHGALWLLDPGSGRVAFVNAAYEAIWGRPSAGLHADASDWLHGVLAEDAAHARERHAHALTGAEEAFEFRIVDPHHGIRWIHAREFPVRAADGQLIAIAGLAEDVSENRRAREQLRQYRERFEGIVQAAMDAIVRVDARQDIVLVNPAAEAMFGYAAAELFGKPLNVLIPKRFAHAHTHQVESFGRFGQTTRHMGALNKVFGLRQNGEEFPLEVSISRHETSEGMFYTAIMRDVSQSVRAQRRIEYLNHLYAVLSAINQLIVRVTDRDELFAQACRILVEQGGFLRAWIGRVDRAAGRIEPVVAAGADDGFLASIRSEFPLFEHAAAEETLAASAVRTGRACVVVDLHADPRTRDVHEKLAPAAGAKAALPLQVGGQAVGVFVLHSAHTDAFDAERMRLLEELAGDIAFAVDHIAKAEHLDYVSRFDVLTGLAGQKLWSERLNQRLVGQAANEGPIAVFALDIEHFRNVNQAFGRASGDELLRLVAQRLLPYDDPRSSRFGRIGGDHFAIFASNLESVEGIARYLDRRLAETFQLPFDLPGGQVRVAAKVGVALYPGDGNDADELLRSAEAALKKAKDAGQRYLFFAPEMTARVAERLALEARLRRAVERQEFVLHYQPKATLADGRLSGCEALIRWCDPEAGLVSPLQFIPVLEEIGLIHEVGAWVLQTAVADYLRWRDEGRPAVRIAVNVSPLQLRSSRFADTVAAALRADPRARDGIELEITESAVMEDVRQNVAVLRAIRALGASIAIDDFGTGFSSLSYLSKLPLDTLKIDRAFVEDMTAGPEGLALVSMIVNLAHSIGLKVVAEGVESEDQRRLLQALRCDQLQGYLYAHPLDRAQFEERFLTPAAHPHAA
ncbi:MAG: EAL domain-containing protein [Proteobacteria bacterium]|nr:EAL domain-containing protein [Pseudomonadota bacterium]MBS0465436.1 EAL domain-containing protein [Pseudomonadota bacterium]